MNAPSLKPDSFMIRTLIFIFLLVSTLVVEAQPDFYLGDGLVENGASDRPAAYATNWRSAKYQYTVTAVELQALGMGPSIIQSIAFDVVSAAPHAAEGFTIRVGEYGGGVFEFAEGLQSCYGPSDYQPVEGWNIHAFENPFVWDGTTDLIVETCFANEQFNSGFENSIGRATTYANVGIARYSDYSGPNTACDDVTVENFLQSRPNMRITAISTEVAPTALFSIASYTDCSGTVSLQDESFYSADSWLWHFGDGTTSEEQHPVHTYLNDGTYDISLIVANEYGSDSVAMTGAVTVALPEELPIVADCLPQTQDQSAGFGPVQVQLTNVNNYSANGSVGYEDYTCLIAELTAGQTHQIAVNCDGGTQSFVVAWIDYNGDGTFSTQEKILAQQTAGVLSTSFTVPPTALTGELIRMRITADFYLNGELGPCDDPAGGQTEDYSVRIIANTLPPIPVFLADVVSTCDGLVQFIDQTQNAPESWYWEFGDGEVSDEQNPVHTYSSSGTYSVTLSATNGFGQVDTTYADLISVDLSVPVSPASCMPTTTEHCCGYGIQDVEFAGILNTSENGAVGYEDFSCGGEGSLTEGESLPYTIVTSGENPHDLRIYLDGNDDGMYDPDELILFSANATIHTGSIQVPSEIPVNGSRIRLRLSADYVGNENTACSAPLFGQVEDYAVIVHADSLAPNASFIAEPTFSCDGLVDFYDTSSGSVDSVIWYFGDGSMANGRQLSYQYGGSGIYTVSMVAFNGMAVDSVSFENYITVDHSAICDTLSIPMSDTLFADACDGWLADNGGAGDYSNDSDGLIVLSADVGKEIRLEFSEFSFLNGDSLILYDGTDIHGPVLGRYSGFDLPNGGTVVSRSASMTIRQTTDDFGTSSGFSASWACQTLSVDENGQGSGVSVYPIPAQDVIHLRSSDPSERILSIELRDAQGRNVLREDIGPSNELIHTVELSGLSDGFYQLTMRFDTYRLTSRMVISR